MSPSRKAGCCETHISVADFASKAPVGMKAPRRGYKSTGNLLQVLLPAPALTQSTEWAQIGRAGENEIGQTLPESSACSRSTRPPRSESRAPEGKASPADSET